MKKQFFYAVPVRRVVNRFVMTVFVVAAGLATQAQTSVKQPLVVPTASVTYIGSQEDVLSVAVKYDNTPGNRFTVTVKDEEGYLLYTGSFSEKKFSKIFQLPKTELSKATFTIRNTKTNEAQSFEINTRVVEEVVVSASGN